MGEPARETLDIAEFPGLVREVSQYALPPGASPVQVNVTSEGVGKLDVRAGYREVTFEDQ
jgi:hypothetical protein